MGMSSSQARLLTLTARMHDIEYRAQRLEAQKLQMANESRRAYESYLEAIDATKIQYKGINGDGSITFRDATLRTLENGAIPDYGGEASYKPYLLKNGMTDEIYVTPEFAAAFGIEDTSELPPLGTLEQWLEEYPGLSRTGNFVENVVTPPVDLRTVYANDITESVTRPEMTQILHSALPESLSISEHTGWDISGIGGYLPSVPASEYNWRDANGWTYYNLTSGPYYTAKNPENKGIVGTNYSYIRKSYDRNNPSDYNVDNSFNYDFAISFQYDSYGLSLLEGLVTGVVPKSSDLSGIKSSFGNSATSLTSRSNGHYTCVFDDTDLSTFMYYAVQVMTDVLDQYGTDPSVVDHSSTAYKTVKDFYDVMNLMAGADYEGNSTDPDRKAVKCYKALLKFCKDYGFNSYLNDDLTDFKTHKNSFISCCEDNSHTTKEAKIYLFGGASEKTYQVVSDYTENDMRTLVKIALIKAGTPENQATSIVEGLNEYALYKVIKNYNDSSAWASCIGQLADGSFRPGNAPDSFNIIYTGVEDKINITGTQSVTDPANADTINFEYTRDSYNNQVLYDICKTDNTINKQTYESFVSTLSDEEMASLMALKFNNPDAYNTIIQSIINANSDEDYAAIKAALQSCAGKTIRWGDRTVDFTQTPERVGKGKIEIPTLPGIASNIYVAMKQNGIDSLTEGEILNYLQTNYGEDNFDNNLILAFINEKACTGDISILTQISNGTVINNAHLGLEYIEQYNHDAYDITRNISGRASDDWVHDEIYEQAVREYNQRQALRDTKFKIIKDEDLLNSTEFLSNWLTLNEGYLLEFDPETFGMVDTNVAVTTHLQEVSDERNLKKAEAQYEADMKRIDMKDRRYDTQLAALDTERNAIKLEMETVKTVAKDNVDRTFRLFS